MTNALIICVYKQPEFLKLVLRSVIQQSVLPEKVIIAEDDQSVEIKAVLDEFALQLNIIHVTQEDEGFRKNKILNKAIRSTRADFLIIIDGDCVLHKHFVKNYLQFARQGKMFYGRRVWISEKLTSDVLKTLNIRLLNLVNLIKHSCKRWSEGIYFPVKFTLFPKPREIWGCNWGIMRNHLIEINGYDEDYKLAGHGEDHDVQWRLEKIGLTTFSMKHRAIVYHLHHKANYNEKATKTVQVMMKKKQLAGFAVCKNGLTKL